ncbi:MAG: TraB/GumN family protein [Gammaproteobacteria bacterium]|jgi:uncharacterized protein
MRRLLLLLIFVFTLAAAESRSADEARTPALIRLDTDPPSWLFGTIHLPDPRVTSLHPAVADAFRQADAVFTEVPMDAGSTLQMSLHGIRRDGKTLYDVLPESTWKRLDARLKCIHPGLTAATLLPMKTWAVHAGMPVLESSMKYPAAKPLDWQLYIDASDAGKDVGGLETLEEQLQLFEAFSDQQHQLILDSLLDAMDDFDARGISVTEYMIQWYLSGDYDRLQQLLEEIPMAHDARLREQLENTLIYERNCRFAQRIAGKISENPGKSLFFAVGMGHLAGSRSIQACLEREGIGVKTAE